MNTQQTSAVPTPFGIRIPNGHERFITTTNICQIVLIPDGDTTLIYAPHQDAYDQWRLELMKANSEFSLLK